MIEATVGAGEFVIRAEDAKRARFECDHCGRTAGDFEGGSSGMSTGAGEVYRFCHPNAHDRPDCYRLVTVYSEQIGSRKPGGANRDEPDWSRPHA